MKIITYINHIDEVEVLVENKITEAIVGVDLFSRFGRIKIDQVNELAKKLKENGIRPVFEWDVLMVETRFQAIVSRLKEIDLSLFDAIRVQDPGAINYVIEHLPNHKIQLNLETGNHNLIGIKRWISLAKDRVERIVLSIEFPKEKLASYLQELKTPIEFLGLGRILLFYTPRSLLTPHLIDHDDSEVISVHERPIEIKGSSEESPHSGFPIVENMHGTFMFNIKDHCLLENFGELKEMGLEYVRIDLRFFENKSALLPEIAKLATSPDVELANVCKKIYGVPVIRGYYNVNKSDALFSKLKNTKILRKDGSYLGDVMEVNKKKHIGILIRNSERALVVGQNIRFRTPEGKEKTLEVTEIKNSSHMNVDKATNGMVVFVPHVSGISVKSNVYLD
ncbi:peptidase, U32 family [Bacteriovorax sp. BSW11_IV]|uniref:U32 family peptidase n=1 Tax=Bacteriovorax sp. BSW11_IV TaxID=1353529 RepID=UPI00038A55C9|nr:U32 family peptidase [Bacteriovorax sp. BSW11_IV]EQC49476.1 peptidase, U32 family [Bacteriovorax sp. BSW11_IV]